MFFLIASLCNLITSLTLLAIRRNCSVVISAQMGGRIFSTL